MSWEYLRGCAEEELLAGLTDKWAAVSSIRLERA